MADCSNSYYQQYHTKSQNSLVIVSISPNFPYFSKECPNIHPFLPLAANHQLNGLLLQLVTRHAIFIVLSFQNAVNAIEKLGFLHGDDDLPLGTTLHEVVHAVQVLLDFLLESIKHILTGVAVVLAVELVGLGHQFYYYGHSRQKIPVFQIFPSHIFNFGQQFADLFHTVLLLFHFVDHHHDLLLQLSLELPVRDPHHAVLHSSVLLSLRELALGLMVALVAMRELESADFQISKIVNLVRGEKTGCAWPSSTGALEIVSKIDAFFLALVNQRIADNKIMDGIAIDFRKRVLAHQIIGIDWRMDWQQLSGCQSTVALV